MKKMNNIIEKLKNAVLGVVSSISMLFSRVILGKHLFEQEYVKNSMKEEFQEMKSVLKEDDALDTKRQVQRETEKEKISIDDLNACSKQLSVILSNEDGIYLSDFQEYLNNVLSLAPDESISLSYVEVESEHISKEKKVKLDILADKNHKMTFFMDSYGNVSSKKDEISLKKELMEAIIQYNIREKISLLPEKSNFANFVFNEAQYNIITGQDKSISKFHNIKLEVECDETQMVTVKAHGSQLFQGRLEDLMIPEAYETLYNNMYEMILSEIGLEIDFEKKDENQYENLEDFDLSFTEKSDNFIQEDYIQDQLAQEEENTFVYDPSEFSEFYNNEDNEIEY